FSGGSMQRVAALANGQAFFTNGSALYAVNLSDGTTAWSVPGAFTGTPAIGNSAVYALAGSNVQAYDPATGQLLRTLGADQTLTEQPIVTDDALIAASASKTYIFSIASGQLQQTLPFGGKLALANNRLYVTPNDGSIHCFVFPTAPSVAISGNGPFAVAEGAAITIGSLPSADAAGVQWDLNYDGTHFNVDASGSQVNFSAAGLDGPSSRIIAVRALD